jgi:hypothetical protein
MLWKRNVKASLHALVADVLENPPAEYIDLGIPEYTVYTEVQFINQSFAVTEPYIFVVDYGITLALLRLPCVVIEFTSNVGMIGELGNPKRWKVHNVTLHVHGRTRGERDDIVAFLSEQLMSISIYDYSTSPAVLIETVAFDGDVGVGDVHVDDASAEEGTLIAWSMVTFSFQTTRI